jgi:hypothetical protein
LFKLEFRSLWRVYKGGGLVLSALPFRTCRENMVSVLLSLVCFIFYYWLHAQCTWNFTDTFRTLCMELNIIESYQTGLVALVTPWLLTAAFRWKQTRGLHLRLVSSYNLCHCTHGSSKTSLIYAWNRRSITTFKVVYIKHRDIRCYRYRVVLSCDEITDHGNCRNSVIKFVLYSHPQGFDTVWGEASVCQHQWLAGHALAYRMNTNCDR